MIYGISGVVRGRDASLVIVAVGGISVGIHTPHPEEYADNASIELHTVLHWNQETGPHLFGFATVYERAFFMLMISCAGIGPKLALAVLHQVTAASCATAIAAGDIAWLSALKGIGTKKAELLVMQLRSKITHLPQMDAESMGGTYDMRRFTDVAEALRSLRYSSAEVTASLEYIRQQEQLRDAPFDQLMRVALSKLR